MLCALFANRPRNLGAHGTSRGKRARVRRHKPPRRAPGRNARAPLLVSRVDLASIFNTRVGFTSASSALLCSAPRLPRPSPLSPDLRSALSGGPKASSPSPPSEPPVRACLVPFFPWRGFCCAPRGSLDASSCRKVTLAKYQPIACVMLIRLPSSRPHPAGLRVNAMADEEKSRIGLCGLAVMGQVRRRPRTPTRPNPAGPIARHTTPPTTSQRAKKSPKNQTTNPTPRSKAREALGGATTFRREIPFFKPRNPAPQRRYIPAPRLYRCSALFLALFRSPDPRPPCSLVLAEPRAQRRREGF